MENIIKYTLSILLKSYWNTKNVVSTVLYTSLSILLKSYWNWEVYTRDDFGDIAFNSFKVLLELESLEDVEVEKW